MSKTSKSSLAVARAALRVASRALPEQSHHFSPKKFTQHQLFACLVLKTLWKCDFRTATERLTESQAIQELLRLKTIPHFTTLHKASGRLLSHEKINAVLLETLHCVRKDTTIELAALDATGLESGHISPYFLKQRSNAKKHRKNNTFTPWPKLAAIADTTTHLIAAALPTRGPGSDSSHFKTILDAMPKQVAIVHLLADAGYDCERNHAYAREQLGIKTTIPPKVGKPSAMPKKHYRKLMKEHFDSDAYRKRWQVETVFSMIKRNLGYTVAAKTQPAQNSQLLLIAITHNLMVVLCDLKLFYKAEIRNTKQIRNTNFK